MYSGFDNGLDKLRLRFSLRLKATACIKGFPATESVEVLWVSTMETIGRLRVLGFKLVEQAYEVSSELRIGSHSARASKGNV